MKQTQKISPYIPLPQELADYYLSLKPSQKRKYFKEMAEELHQLLLKQQVYERVIRHITPSERDSQVSSDELQNFIRTNIKEKHKSSLLISLVTNHENQSVRSTQVSSLSTASMSNNNSRVQKFSKPNTTLQTSDNCRECERHKLTISELRKDIQKLQQHNITKINENKNLNQLEIDRLSNQITKSAQQYKKVKIIKDQLEKENIQLKQKLQLKQQLLYSQNSLNQQLKTQILALKQASSKKHDYSYETCLAENPFLFFINSRILSFRQPNISQQDIQFILNSIEHQYGATQKIRGLKFLLSRSYFTEQKVNFHEFIDEHPFLLFIAKLKQNGAIIGAYSDAPFSPNQKYNDSQGFIFSVTEKRVFNLTQKARGRQFAPYHPYCFCFGNGDLKFEMTQMILSSNFGFESSYFKKSENDTVSDLFGLGDCHKVEMQDYEFYSVEFER